jgi:hypothetical protein
MNNFSAAGPRQADWWRTNLVDICDGGESVWGALYDTGSGQFSDLLTNGFA